LKIGVVGKNGQLAKSISFINKEYEIVYFDKDAFQILDFNDVKKTFFPFEFEVIINCSAYTNVELAETNKTLAYNLNVKGLSNLVTYCKQNKIFLIHISTDYVFDGLKRFPYTEEDQTNPISIYGKTKEIGEKVILESKLPSLIIRTSGLFSHFGNNIYMRFLKLLKEEVEINVCYDQITSPTSSLDLARIILSLIIRQKNILNPTLIHVTNSGSASWYDFIKRISDNHGIYKTQINKVLLEELDFKANRPKYSVLSTQKLYEEFEIKLRSWENALVEVSLIAKI